MERIRVNWSMGLAAVLAAVLLAGCESETSTAGGRHGEIHRPGKSTAPPGFLWKPTSDTNNKLVMLFPSSMTGDVISGEVHSDMPPTTETFLEAGWFGGIHNGGREHWRFQKHGSGYGQNVYAVANMKDGTYHAWLVADGNRRTEY